MTDHVLYRSERVCQYDEEVLNRPPTGVRLQGPKATLHNPLQYKTPAIISSIAAAVYAQTVAVLGSSHTRDIIHAFATGTYLRLPILALHSFARSVPILSEKTAPDSILLCLAMYLIEQRPSPNPSTETPAYMSIKQMIGLLEASGSRTLKFLQARILVMVYELGHGLLSAASISLGACTRAARLMVGLRELGIESSRTELGTYELDEKRRVWWGLFTLDRFINGSIGDAIFGLPNPKLTDKLPYSDRIWMDLDSECCETSLSGLSGPSLDAPFDADFGQFGRECQIAHLAGRVFEHVFGDPAGDKCFQDDEAEQLERTLWAFLPLLDHADLEFGVFCGALAIACR